MSTPNDPYAQQPADSSYPAPPADPYGAPSQAPASYPAQPDAQASGYAYPSAPPAYGYAAPAAAKTNTLAIVALVGSFFVSLVGIICGHIALKQISQTGEGGRGMALAGLIIGYVGLAFGIIAIIFYIVLISAAVSSGYSSY